MNSAGRRGSGWWWWALWLIVGAAMAVQVVGMRLAEAAVWNGNGVRAALIRPQNGWGVALLAELQFARGDARSALATSRQAMRDTPLAVVGLRTFARSQDRLQAGGAGERAWQVASMMGWRDKPTQLWAVLRALANGDAQVFAIRADALLRTGDSDGQMASVVRQALVDPRIRAAFIERMATNPPWRTRFFFAPNIRSGRELEGTMQTLLDLGRAGRPPQRQDLRDTIRGLIALRRYGEAVALDRRFVRRSADAGSLIDDGGFELRGTDYRTSVTGFDWNIVQGLASLDQSGGRRSMAVTFDGNRKSMPVDRYVALPPGRYAIEYAMKADQPETGSALGLLAYCAATGEELARSAGEPLRSAGWERRGLTVTLPPRCGLLRLLIGPLPQANPAEALFDDVIVRPAP